MISPILPKFRYYLIPIVILALFSLSLNWSQAETQPKIEYGNFVHYQKDVPIQFPDISVTFKGFAGRGGDRNFLISDGTINKEVTGYPFIVFRIGLDLYYIDVRGGNETLTIQRDFWGSARLAVLPKIYAVVTLIVIVLYLFGISRLFANSLLNRKPVVAAFSLLFVPVLLATLALLAFSGPVPNNPEGWGPAPAMAMGLVFVISVAQAGACMVHAVFLYLFRNFRKRPG